MHDQPDTDTTPTLELDRVRLCEQLDLDPNQTTMITFDVDSRVVTATWTGQRRLTADELARIIAAASVPKLDRPLPTPRLPDPGRHNERPA